MADLLYQHSDNVIEIPVVNESGEAVPASSFPQAEYTLYSTDGKALINLAIGQGVTVQDDKFVVTVEDYLMDFAVAASYKHQLVVWNVKGDKLPPVYINDVTIQAVYEKTEDEVVFIVEDGTGLPDSNSYVSLEYASAYFKRIGFKLWNDMDDNACQDALINATEYVDVRWGSRIGGTLLKTTQALEFPRKGLFDHNWLQVTGVPLNLKKAVCEYAMQSTKGPLISDSANTDAALKKKKITVGPITTEKEFAEVNAKGSFTSYPKADAFMKGFVVGGGSSSRVIRN